MKYPHLSLKRANEPYMAEMKAVAAEVIEGGWYIRGKYVSQLEELLCQYLGCRYAVATGNGLDALRLMLRAYIERGVMQPGDEVIVPSNTYVASVLAITDNRLVPVFVEPSVDTYNLDTSLIEQAITPRTRAIMVVHLYGRACWDETLKSVAARHGLKIVEDNAQAFGAVSSVAGLQGSHHTGALGDAAGESFYPTKNLGALGDAGAVTTDARLYTESIDNERLILPQAGEPGEHIWHQYVVRCTERDRLMRYLESQGVGSLIHYPIPPHKQQCYREYNHLHLPLAETLAHEVLSLPMSSYLTDDDVHEIASIINRFA